MIIIIIIIISIIRKTASGWPSFFSPLLVAKAHSTSWYWSDFSSLSGLCISTLKELTRDLYKNTKKQDCYMAPFAPSDNQGGRILRAYNTRR